LQEIENKRDGENAQQVERCKNMKLKELDGRSTGVERGSANLVKDNLCGAGGQNGGTETGRKEKRLSQAIVARED
jgi:hypothetical protein